MKKSRPMASRGRCLMQHGSNTWAGQGSRAREIGEAEGEMKVEARTTGVYFGQQKREFLTERQIAVVDSEAQRHSSSGTRRKNREGMRHGCKGRDRPPLLQSGSSPVPVPPLILS